MSLADRRAAALAKLGQRPAGPPRWPGETKPSGDIPDDPQEAAAYFAKRGPEVQPS